MERRRSERNGRRCCPFPFLPCRPLKKSLRESSIAVISSILGTRHTGDSGPGPDPPPSPSTPFTVDARFIVPNCFTPSPISFGALKLPAVSGTVVRDGLKDSLRTQNFCVMTAFSACALFMFSSMRDTGR